MGDKDEAAVQAELENQLDLSPGTLSGEVWDNLYAGLRRGHYEGELSYIRRLGYLGVLYNKGVLRQER